MTQDRQARVMVSRYRDGSVVTEAQQLLVEEALEIRLDGQLVSTTMRTPGHDFELSVGFCHTEGLLAGAAVTGTRYGSAGVEAGPEVNVVSVETGGVAPVPQPRIGTTNSACGICGSVALKSLTDRLEPVACAPFDWALVSQVSAEAGIGQELFQATGAAHSAAAFRCGDGAVLEVREDIGRHNAVDKVIGRLLLDGVLPSLNPGGEQVGLWVSGRASFEMVQKAWAGGFVLIASVSAPSALAVEVAQAGGLGLAGFARGHDLTVYHQPWE